MLFFVTGASGAGKSAALPKLATRFPGMVWHEFDSVGVPSEPDTRWRQNALESWVQVALEHQARGGHVGVCGQVAYGEILASPSTPEVDGLAVCLLDCDDITRIDRLRRQERSADQDTLNWAAWLRVHAVDPEWRPDVISASGAEGFEWERWHSWRRGDPRWQVAVLDNSGITVRETVDRIAAWVQTELQTPKNPAGGAVAARLAAVRRHGCWVLIGE